MSNNYEKKAIQYIQARKRRKKRRRAVAALAALVVMLTGYTLVTPAVTMQGETYCGYEEHTAHDRACYEPEGTLLCGCAGEGHQHTESCFGEQTVLICQLTETDGHEHGELCFCEEDFPVCGHDDPEHEHDADCYERRRVLICEEPEQEAHQHDESCYATERQLICEEHTHTEGCYEPDGDPDTLLCELPLHRHTLQCYSEPEADRESPAIREASFASVTLSGMWREDVLAIAETQLGYAESERNYMVQEDGISRKGYTRYGDWYGAPYADWCAIFCSFCLHYAGIDTAVIPAEASCEQWIGKLEPLGRYHAADGYVPQPGDLIFFDFDEQEEGADRKADHVGFVSEVIFDEAFDRPVELRTIEGNKGGRVARDSYQADSSSILGYAELPESSDGIEMTALSAMRLSAAENSAVSLVRVDMAWLTEVPDGQGVIVTLFRDGMSTGQTLTLDSTNGWQGEFSGLEPGDYSITYTSVNGYSLSSYDSVSEGSLWSRSDSLTEGRTYVLVHNNSTAVQNSSGTSLSATAVKISEGTLSEAPLTAQWSYNGTLRNEESGNYLLLTGTGAYLSEKQGSVFSYTDAGALKLSSSTRYLRYNGGYTQTTRASYATAFTLYEKTADTVEYSFHIIGEKIQFNPNDGASSFEHNKTIDYLNDGKVNPDTSVQGEDLYRLYLDMTGKQEPMDLLLVVDGSGSMDKTDMDGRMARDTAITKFLNGRTDRSTKDGFLAFFLGVNSENRVSVVQFYGTSESPDRNLVSAGKHDFSYDSTVLLDWTGQNSFVNCANKNNNGTNYEAGLARATDQFSRVSGDGHRKLMIFLSDGVPTYFLINADDVGTVCGDYTIRAADIGKRWGNGQYASTANYPYCKEPSKRAFDNFVSSNPGVTVFTIGVSADISETSQSESQSPEVLKYMAEKGGGSFLSVMSNMDELKYSIESIFYPAGVTIRDSLSRYVRLYNACPDVLVTMSDKSSGEVTVLYQNGSVTEAGEGILAGVSYTPGDTEDAPAESTGMMSAEFDPDYRFSPQYTYTLSFNVKTTRSAYDEYTLNGYNASGDRGTDYRENTTSSEKPGFFSNTAADVSYIVSGDRIKESYRLPVVQVNENSCGYVLPETGGEGIYTLLGAGLLLVSFPLLYVCRPLYRRERYSTEKMIRQESCRRKII